MDVDETMFKRIPAISISSQPSSTGACSDPPACAAVGARHGCQQDDAQARHRLFLNRFTTTMQGSGSHPLACAAVEGAQHGCLGGAAQAQLRPPRTTRCMHSQQGPGQHRKG
eukprot:668502-Pelagomonas_calceolata.AAC.1